jgi:MarR family transcriptional regulator, transcriptional regulator for hemolysin
MAGARNGFELDRHVFFWLTQVIGARDRALSPALRPFGLRVPEWRVLAALYSRRRCSMREVAELASIDRTTLTRTVDRMEAGGWLERVSDADDLRITRVALTASGEALFGRVWPVVKRLNESAVAGLPAGAVQTLRAMLARMKSNLDDQPANDERAA